MERTRSKPNLIIRVTFDCCGRLITVSIMLTVASKTMQSVERIRRIQVESLIAWQQFSKMPQKF